VATGSYTYTITLDEAICPASGTGKVRFNNWTKILTVNTQTITDVVQALGKTSTELQIKLELRGTGDNPEINQLVVLSASQLKIV
jgi:vacuolar-type H+-ATPase subunit B/Vma2